jgi:Tol biopolymer transport system component
LRISRDGNFDLWVQPVGEGNSIRVTTSLAHDWQPDWSPEGNRLILPIMEVSGGIWILDNVKP